MQTRKNLITLLLAFLVAVPAAFGQESLIQNVSNRNTKTLNGKWHYIVDMYQNGYYDYRYQPYDENEAAGDGAYFTNTKQKDKTHRVEYNFDKSPTMLVPRDWNSQEEELFRYEGSVWYKKSFDFNKSQPSNRVFVHFGAANYEADVYLNGQKLGKHTGGFTPFNFEITDKLKAEDNYLIVKVDNQRSREQIPTLNYDWMNYGGLTRNVQLIETRETFILDYFIQLEKGSQEKISGYVKLDGPAKSNQSVEIAIPEAGIHQTFTTNNNGKAKVNFSASDLELWTPKNPHRYNIKLSAGESSVDDQIGFRSIETDGTDILLNDEKVFLRGISIHEVNPIRGGRAYSKEDARMLLTWAKELGCNFVRLAHYPHNVNMNRMAEKMGIMVWEEIPVYWTILWENEATFQNAANQLKEMIHRDKNRASTIIWSMANETPLSDARLHFLKNLTDTARSIDNTRLISAALEEHAIEGNPNTRIVEDPFAKHVDVVSFNQYIGWYDGLPSKLKKIDWKITYDKPVIISEFGAGALQGMHGDSITRWSEEYQANLYDETLKMLEKIPQLRGLTPWILTDFRSPRRHLPDIQDGWNRKGLISETGDKKMAFEVLQNYYEEKKKDGAE